MSVRRYIWLLMIGFWLTTAARAETPILIGLDADMSSVAAEGGKAIESGALIAIEEINRAGGVLRRPLELVVRDHRGNPARGKRNIEAFSKMPDLVAVLGGVHTPVALQELELIHQYNLLYLGPWAAGTAIVDNGFSPNFVFRVSVRDAEAAKVLLAHAKQSGLTRIALALERTGWGRSNLTSITEQAELLDIAITQVTWINWRQQQFTDEMQQIANSEAQAIVLVANAPEGAVIIDAALNNQATKTLPVISHWGLAGGSFVAQLGLDNLQQADVRVLQTFHPQRPINPEVTQRVLQAYNQATPDYNNDGMIPGAVGLAHAYDLVSMLALAMSQAQSTDAEKVMRALENLEQYTGVVKTYVTPFSADKHDALWADDYFMTRYNNQGHLVPIAED